MNRLTTETRNTQTMHLDEMTIQDALLTINRGSKSTKSH